jgi:ribosome-associated toxin RatA of RatAB toxin-antitoxin module
MQKLQRQASVPFSAKQMYDLINDVDAYVDFLPYCSNSAVLEDEGDNQVLASVEVSAAGVNTTFVTRNKLTPCSHIEMEHVEGPFKRLFGAWTFSEKDGQCHIDLSLEFEVKSGLKAKLFGMFYNKVADKLVSTFCERAQQLYGKEASSD